MDRNLTYFIGQAPNGPVSATAIDVSDLRYIRHFELTPTSASLNQASSAAQHGQNRQRKQPSFNRHTWSRDIALADQGTPQPRLTILQQPSAPSLSEYTEEAASGIKSSSKTLLRTRDSTFPFFRAALGRHRLLWDS